MPELLDVVSEDDGVLPTVRKAAEGVAEFGAEFGHDPEFVIGTGSGKPVEEGL